MFQRAAKLVISSVEDKSKKERDFFMAVVTGDLNLIGKSIKEGVNLNALDNDDLTALHRVAEKGDVDVGKYLLSQKNIDINKHDLTRNGNSPLITAVTFDRLHFVSLLLHNKANPNIKNNFGQTALHYAVKKRNIGMVKVLLISKAQPKIFDAYGNTPLGLSVVEYHNKKIAAILLRWDADPNFRTMKPHPLLLELALNSRSEEQLRMMRLLLRYRADVNITNLISKQTALHMVSITGYVPLALLLLKHGANDNLRDLTGRTPYDMAIEHDHRDLIQFYKVRKIVIEDIMEGISVDADQRLSISPSGIISKRKKSSRTVRFSELRASKSDEQPDLPEF